MFSTKKGLAKVISGYVVSMKYYLFSKNYHADNVRPCIVKSSYSHCKFNLENYISSNTALNTKLKVVM